MPGNRNPPPGIAERMAAPAFVHAINFLSGAAARLLQRFNKTKQRLAPFAQIGHFTGPVSLLGIDMALKIQPQRADLRSIGQREHLLDDWQSLLVGIEFHSR